MMGDDYQRMIYKAFDADIEPGNVRQADLDQVSEEVFLKGDDGKYLTGDDGGFLTSEDLVTVTPQIFLSFSDDRGRTYGNPIGQSMGLTGEFLTTVSWNRLGMARDRVFKLQWSCNLDTALNGGFVDAIGAAT